MTTLDHVCRDCGRAWQTASTGDPLMDRMVALNSRCVDCWAQTCDGCGLVFRDVREAGLIRHSVYDAEAGAYLWEQFCPRCDSQCHEGAA